MNIFELIITILYGLILATTIIGMVVYLIKELKK